MIGHLPRTVGVVQRVFDLVRRNTQRRSVVAVDIHDHFRAGNLQIAVDVEQARARLSSASQSPRTPDRVLSNPVTEACTDTGCGSAGRRCAPAEDWSGTSACRESCSAWGAVSSMICSGVSLRCVRGFKRMKIRPALAPLFPPLALTVEKTASTFGSACTIAAACGLGRHHGVEGSILRQLGGALDLSRVLVGDESGGDHAVTGKP